MVVSWSFKHGDMSDQYIQYADVTRMLQMYQVWLDDLFPKAEFLDALAMVEKQGHKRQMQSMRMQWINEARPRDSHIEDDTAQLGEAAPTETSLQAPFTSLHARQSPNDDRLYNKEKYADEINTDNLLRDALPRHDPFDDDNDVDLDELMMEAQASAHTGIASKPTREPDMNFEDDMEAMAQLEGAW